MSKPSIYLITGNAKKLQEFKQILGDQFDINNQNIDLPEIQGDPQEVAKEKVQIAYSKSGKAVVTEDTSLCFNAYHGLPGPYIKWFLKAINCEGLSKMVQPFDDKTGYAMCILAYMAPDLSQPILFIGKTAGKIVEPRGSRDFGWDPVFEPEGYDKTYAQLPKEEKNKISHRFRAIQQMKKYFLEKNQAVAQPAVQPVIEKKEENNEKKVEVSSKKEQKSAKKAGKSAKKDDNKQQVKAVQKPKKEQEASKRPTRSTQKSEKKEAPKTSKKEQASGKKSKGK